MANSNDVVVPINLYVEAYSYSAAYYSANLQLQNLLNSNVSILLHNCRYWKLLIQPSNHLPVLEVSLGYLAIATVVGTVAVAVLEVPQLVQLRP